MLPESDIVIKPISESYNYSFKITCDFKICPSDFEAELKYTPYQAMFSDLTRKELWFAF